MGAPGRAEELVMSDSEFRMLAELFKSHCGLHFGQESRYLLERRIARRCADLGLRSFNAYHYALRNDTSGEGELAWAIDNLTTNETYFLRERAQLMALIEEIIPSLQARSGGAGVAPASIWSAQTDPFLREKYFSEKDGQFRISDEIKKHVSFAHLNLLDESRSALLGSLDVVLCRNVIIYFDIETKRRVVRTFHQKLKPGGFLLLGHSESLINLSTDFELKHLRHDMVYRKPADDDPWHETAERTLARLERRGGR